MRIHDFDQHDSRNTVPIEHTVRSARRRFVRGNEDQPVRAIEIDR